MPAHFCIFINNSSLVVADDKIPYRLSVSWVVELNDPSVRVVPMAQLVIALGQCSKGRGFDSHSGSPNCSFRTYHLI